MCLFDDALTSGSAIVSKTHSPCSQSCDFWEKLRRYYGAKIVRSSRKVGGHYYADRKHTVGLVNPTYKKLKRFFAGAQNDKNTFLVPYCLSNLVSSKKAAFTLAEVLITLGIIGVVAAMTIPTLISNYQEKTLNTQFKRAYALINQGLANVQAQYAGYLPKCYYSVSNADIQVATDCLDVSEKFISLLKIAKKCEGSAFADGCIPEYEGMDTVANANNPDAEVPDGYEDYGEYISKGCLNFRKNAILTSRTVYVLADGTIIIPYDSCTISGLCAGIRLIAVDVNGKKGPNKWGHDLFSFLIRSDGQRFKYYGGGCMQIEEGGQDTNTMIDKIIKNQI